MTMKKAFTLLLIAFLALCFNACTSGGEGVSFRSTGDT